jgi:hypothetical protein
MAVRTLLIAQARIVARRLLDDSEAGAVTRSRLELSGVVAVAAAAAAVLFARVQSFPLMGIDTFPEIASSRISTFDDFIGTFTEQTAEGYFPHAFYRPVFNAAFALDFALSGIEPAGYYLTSVILFAFSGVALFLLARRLLGPTAHLGPWVALFGFLLLPVHIEVVPILSRRMDLLCGLFSILALATQIPRIDRSRPPGGLLPALLTLLAVGSKEPGVILPVLVFLMVVFLRPATPLGERCRRAALVALPHLTAVALVIVARFMAIGGLGGHPATSLSGGVTRLPWAIGSTVVRLSSLWLEPGPIDAWLLHVVAIGVLGVMVATLIRVFAPGAERAVGVAPVRSALVGMAFGLGWLVLLCSIYAINGQYRAWYLFLPGQAVALLVGAVSQRLCLAARAGARVRSVLGLSLVCVWMGFQARHSPLFHEYPHWRAGAARIERYFAYLGARIESSSNGRVIHIRLPPLLAPAPLNPMGAEVAPLATGKSLRAWAELRFPERRIRFVDAAAEAGSDELVVRLHDLVEAWTGRKEGADSSPALP